MICIPGMAKLLRPGMLSDRSRRRSLKEDYENEVQGFYKHT